MSSNAGDTLVANVDTPTFAPSLPVPNVQEMAKDPSQVPERYIRNQEERPQLNGLSHLSSQIPVIDLSLLATGDINELNKLDLACKDWGFFQVLNHGLAKDVLQNMKNFTAEFFQLPLEEKKKYAMASDDIQGYGQAYVVSEEQKLDWSDTLVLVAYPAHYRKFKFWPSTPKGFKEIFEAYSKAVKNVGEELLRSIATILKIDKDAFLGVYDELQVQRFNYYPPCSIPDHVLGISPHSDTSIITILMQEGDVNGLQIRHKEGWVPVTPLPDALVVNVGDVIEILSNGKYKSIEHQVVTNESRARISYASFLAPRDDMEIEPLDHLVDSEKPVKMYKKVKYGDYLRSTFKRKMEGKAHTDVAKVGA